MTLAGKVGVQRVRNRDYSYTFRLSWWERDEYGPRRHLTKRLLRTPPDLDHEQLAAYILTAKAAAKEKTKRMHEAAKGPVYEPVQRKHYRATIPHAVRHYLEEIDCRPMSDSWRAQLVRVVGTFEHYLYEHQPSIRHASSIGFEHVNNWRVWRQGEGGGVADSTLLTDCAALQPFLDWLKDSGRNSMEILAITKWQKRYLHPDRSTPNIPEDSRLLEILANQPSNTRRLILATLAGCGLRSGELKGLRIKDYYTDKCILSVPKSGRETTKRHARDIPLGPWLAGELEQHCWQRHRVGGDDAPLFIGAEGKPLTRQINTWLSPWGHTPHDLRRWFGNTLLRLGCPDPIRCALMAHTLNARDSAYYVPTLADKRPWTLRIDDLLGGQLVS